MFEFTKKHTGGAMQSYNKLFAGKLVAITAKDKIYFTAEIIDALGNPSNAAIGFNSSEWAVKPGDSSDYKVCTHGKATGNTRYISAGKDIKKKKLPVGYVFQGRIENGMIIFSMVPSEKV